MLSFQKHSMYFILSLLFEVKLKLFTYISEPFMLSFIFNFLFSCVYDIYILFLSYYIFFLKLISKEDVKTN